MTDMQKGLVYMTLSCVMMGVMWVAIRVMSDTLSTPVIILYRNLFGFLAMLPFLLKYKRAAFKAHNVKLHFARAASALVAMYCIFYAITVSPISQVVAVTYAAPIIAAVGMVLLLGEKIKLRRVVAIIVGFLGMLMVVQPGSMEFTQGIMIGMVGAACIGFTVMLIKVMAGTDKAETITLYNFMITLPISFVIALFYWQMPTFQELLFLAAIGINISFSQVFLARAFSLADATAVLPLDFIRLLLATFFGVWLFGEPVDPMVMMGAAIILVSTVYTAHRESLASKQEK